MSANWGIIWDNGVHYMHMVRVVFLHLIHTNKRVCKCGFTNRTIRSIENTTIDTLNSSNACSPPSLSILSLSTHHLDACAIHFVLGFKSLPNFPWTLGFLGFGGVKASSIPFWLGPSILLVFLLGFDIEGCSFLKMERILFSNFQLEVLSLGLMLIKP